VVHLVQDKQKGSTSATPVPYGYVYKPDPRSVITKLAS